MSPYEQRIAIAEACGWAPELVHVLRFNDDGTTFTMTERSNLPDYLNDLNAMHEAEKVLTAKQKADYVRQLRKNWSPDSLSLDALIESTFEATLATATQRAEAFLRTIGKWDAAK